MNDAFEEYCKRLVPPSDREIIALAEKMWADAKLRATFERVGLHGDFTAEEETAIEAAISEYRQGDLWDRDDLHLALAPCLLRRLAAGIVDKLDNDETRSFIEGARVERAGAMMRPVKTTVREVLDFGEAIHKNPDASEMINRLGRNPNAFVHEVDLEGVLARFEDRYRRKYGLLNRGALAAAIGLLRGVAEGSLEAMDSPEAIESLRRVRGVCD